MSQILKQVTVPIVLCIMLEQTFAFPPPPLLYWSIKTHHDYMQADSVFSTHRVALPVLSYVSVFLSRLCSSYLTFLIHTPLPSNVQTHHAWIVTEVTPKMWLLTCSFDRSFLWFLSWKEIEVCHRPFLNLDEIIMWFMSWSPCLYTSIMLNQACIFGLKLIWTSIKFDSILLRLVISVFLKSV